MEPTRTDGGTLRDFVCVENAKLHSNAVPHAINIFHLRMGPIPCQKSMNGPLEVWTLHIHSYAFLLQLLHSIPQQQHERLLSGCAGHHDRGPIQLGISLSAYLILYFHESDRHLVVLPI